MGGQVYTVGEVIKATNIDANFHHFSLHTESPITFELVWNNAVILIKIILVIYY